MFMLQKTMWICLFIIWLLLLVEASEQVMRFGGGCGDLYLVVMSSIGNSAPKQIESTARLTLCCRALINSVIITTETNSTWNDHRERERERDRLLSPLNSLMLEFKLKNVNIYPNINKYQRIRQENQIFIFSILIL